MSLLMMVHSLALVSKEVRKNTKKNENKNFACTPQELNAIKFYNIKIFLYAL